MSAILLILMLAAVFGFGVTVTVFIFHERRLFAALPVGCLIGLYGFTLSLNVISYFIPIHTASRVLLVFFGAVAAWLGYSLVKTHKRDFHPTLARKQRTALLLTVFVIALWTGVVAFRSRHSDDLSLTHMSLAATIEAGNFPVLDPSSPDHPVEYHYIPEMLAAVFANLTGVPLWLGYDLQKIIFSALTVALAFALAFQITSRARDSVLASALLFFGGGLRWLNFPEGFDPLWRTLVRKETLEAPWAFLASVINPGYAAPLSLVFHNHTPAVGFPLALLILTLVIFYVLPRDRNRSIPATVAAALLMGHLALVEETDFLILFAVFAAFACVLIADRVWRLRSRALHAPFRADLLASCFVILFVGVAVAAPQGGILKQKLLRADELGPRAFVLNERPWTLNFDPVAIPIFSWEFLKQFGIPLLLFIPAVWFFRRKTGVLILALTGVGAFAAPLVVRYEPGPNELLRIIQFSLPFIAFIVALYLARFAKKRSKKWTPVSTLATLALILVPLQGLLIQTAYTLTPLGKLGRLDYPFFSVPPAPEPLDEAAYRWIRTNTTQKDRFFPYSSDFIRDTGRFAPGPVNPGWGYAKEVSMYEKIVSTCSAESIKSLGITHFYVSPNFPMQDWDDKCRDQLRLRQLFEARDGDDYRNIYKVETVGA